MPDQIPTPAQDLAALDRVAELAARFDLATSELTGILACLRANVAANRHLTDSLGRAFIDAGGPVGRRWPRDLGATSVRAVASVGAQIVFASPEPSDSPEVAAVDATAPEAGGVSAHVPVVLLPCGNIAYRMDLWWREIGPDGRDRGNLINLPPGAVALTEPAVAHAPSTPREKILAEVAECMTHTCLPLHSPPGSAVTAAMDRIQVLFDAGGGMRTDLRERLIGAADLLVFAVERMDGAQ
jgi:hypothetical protein